MYFNRFSSLSTETITDDEGEYYEEIRKYKVEKHYPIYAEKDRYIDVALIFPNGRVVAIECKDHGRKKDVSKIDKFFSLISCANINQGLIVSTHGFTKEAEKKLVIHLVWKYTQ